MDGVPVPVHLVAGNHDDRDALLQAYGGSPYLGGSTDTHYVVEYPQATVIVLDSLVPGQAAGTLGEAQLAWLNGVLARRPHAPAFVAVHHPPIDVGIPFLDGIRLLDGDALGEVVRAHPHVARVLAGHVHRTVSAAFAGTLLTVAPSTYRTSELAMRPDRMIGYLNEPTSFLLHQLTDTSCITHTVPVSHAAAPVRTATRLNIRPAPRHDHHFGLQAPCRLPPQRHGCGQRHPGRRLRRGSRPRPCPGTRPTPAAPTPARSQHAPHGAGDSGLVRGAVPEPAGARPDRRPVGPCSTSLLWRPGRCATPNSRADRTVPVTGPSQGALSAMRPLVAQQGVGWPSTA